MPRRESGIDIVGPPELGEPQDIFDILGFRVSEFYMVSGSLVTRMCEGEFGITREQWAYLAILAAIGEASPSDLARRSMIDRSQGSRTLRVLADKKLISRKAVPGDARRAVVGLTEAGWRLYRRMFPRNVEIHQAVLGSLTAEETRVLARCIHKIHLRALEVEGGDLVHAAADRRRGGSRTTWRPASNA